MEGSSRRTFLKVLTGAAAAGVATQIPLQAFADPPMGQNEFFIFIHASGAWDVMLWADPRNEERGLIDPPNTGVVDEEGIRNWTSAPMAGDIMSFVPVRPSGSNITFGPAIGNLRDLYDRVTLINGIAVNTVSHPDGTVFAATGRHLAGGRAAESSIDTIIANEFGRETLFPVISINFPSNLIGNTIDRRVTPLRAGNIATVGRSLTRSDLYTYPADRTAVTALLSQEATDIAQRQYHPEVFQGMSLQFNALREMLASNLQSVFTASTLQTAYPEFFRNRMTFQAGSAVNAAFAVEAMKRNKVRCVSFAMGGLDTHNSNYRTHALNQQEIFDTVAQLVRYLDMSPHPNLTGETLGAHTHILVVSEFCRTPQINLSGGRDHYPNGSALVISPLFRSNFVYGRSDPDQLLPLPSGRFSDGMRPIAPPDILATFASAFGIDPRRYMRDGEVVRELLRSP
jgi:hypothetical protein